MCFVENTLWQNDSTCLFNSTRRINRVQQTVLFWVLFIFMEAGIALYVGIICFASVYYMSIDSQLDRRSR